MEMDCALQMVQRKDLHMTLGEQCLREGRCSSILTDRWLRYAQMIQMANCGERLRLIC